MKMKRKQIIKRQKMKKNWKREKEGELYLMNKNVLKDFIIQKKNKKWRKIEKRKAIEWEKDDKIKNRTMRFLQKKNI